MTSRTIQGFAVVALSSLLVLPIASQDFNFSDLKIDSDDATFDPRTGEMKLIGSVLLESEGIKLSAEEVTITREDGNLTSFFAVGNPIRLTLRTEEGGEEQKLNAESQTLSYDADNKTIELVDGVKITSEVFDIKAYKIKIDLETRELSATKGEGDDRVELEYRDLDSSND